MIGRTRRQSTVADHRRRRSVGVPPETRYRSTTGRDVAPTGQAPVTPMSAAADVGEAIKIGDDGFDLESG